MPIMTIIKAILYKNASWTLLAATLCILVKCSRERSLYI